MILYVSETTNAYHNSNTRPGINICRSSPTAAAAAGIEPTLAAKLDNRSLFNDESFFLTTDLPTIHWTVCQNNMSPPHERIN